MKRSLLLVLLLAGALPGQMEKRLRVLYDREAFRIRKPAVGAEFPELSLRDLRGKKVDLAELREEKPLVIIGGAYT